MLKKIKMIFLLLVIAVVGYAGWRYSENPQQVYPYPYTLEAIPQDELAQAMEAQILIVGDSAGTYLDPYLEEFVGRASANLKNPLKVYNWARQGETLAHVFHKIKALKKMPLLIIYHGGLDEMDQARFDLKAVANLNKNIAFTKDDALLTTLIGFPPLARLVYWPHSRPILKFYRQREKDIPSPFPADLQPEKALKVMENVYEIYQWEAKQLFSYLKTKDAYVWVIPQAYNLKVPPTRTCENATNFEIEKLLKQASNLIIANKTKEAFSIVNSILMENKTHARALYTMGNLMSKRGDFSSARRAYYQSMLYDCSLRRSNPLFLKILMEQAEKKSFKIINFNQMVTNYLGKNLLFSDLRQPQGIYYNKLIDQMVLEFSKFLNP